MGDSMSSIKNDNVSTITENTYNPVYYKEEKNLLPNISKTCFYQI